MSKLAFVFSGQGSQYPGMGQDLYESSPVARQIYEKAATVFGDGFLSMCFQGAQEELSQTLYAQPAIYTLSMAVLALLKEQGIQPDAVAGFSLGEISAACCAGAFSMEDGMKIVKVRAEAMQRAAEQYGGTMFAILNGDPETIKEVCRGISTGYVVPVNYNAPRQTVIAGEEAAALEAAEILTKEHRAKAVRLAVNGAFHSELIAPAAKEFSDALKDFTFSALQLPCYSDATGEPMETVSADGLMKQMISPVQWVKIIENMSKEGIDTFVEIGPGKTLCGLIKKINRDARTFHVENTETSRNFIEEYRELRGL